MKKLILTVCCLLCVVLLCTACSKGNTVGDFCAAVEYKDNTFVPTTYTRLNALDGLSYDYSSRNHVLFLEDYDDYELIVYNAKTQSTVLTLDLEEVEENSTFTAFGETFIFIVTDDSGEYKSAIYTDGGQKVIEKDGYLDTDDITSYSDVDLFSFDGSIFRVNKGSATLVTDNPFFGSVPSFDYQTSSYYYEVNSNEVTVYNKKLEVVYYWEAPYGEANINILSDDNLLIQEIISLPDAEKKYDVMMDGEKYNIKSYLINVESGKEKSLDLDFVVLDLLYCSSYVTSDVDDFTVSDLDNIACITKIEDKMISNSSSAMELVTINAKNGKIDEELFTDNDNCLYVEPIAKDRYLMDCKSGDTYLVDGNGEIIGQYNGYSDRSNDSFLVKDGRLYDYNLKCVYDLKTEDKTVYGMMAHSVIFQDDDGDFYLYTSSKQTQSINGRVTDYKNGFFIAYDSDNGTYRIYDENGTQIGSNLKCSSLSIISSYKDGCVLSAYVDGEYRYYVLSK